MRHADFVEIGKDKGEMDLRRFPCFSDGVIFMAEISTGTGNGREYCTICHEKSIENYEREETGDFISKWAVSLTGSLHLLKFD
jgi:hypothetical protein